MDHASEEGGEAIKNVLKHIRKYSLSDTVTTAMDITAHPLPASSSPSILSKSKTNITSSSAAVKGSETELNGVTSAVSSSLSSSLKKEIKKDESKPSFYLILHDISKKANIGTMIRSACAFGVKEVLIVGRSKDLCTFGAKGAEGYVPMRFFDTLKEIKDYLIQNGIMMCGVEIRDDSLSVTDSDCFKGPTAFLMGNEVS